MDLTFKFLDNDYFKREVVNHIPTGVYLEHLAKVAWNLGPLPALRYDFMVTRARNSFVNDLAGELILHAPESTSFNALYVAEWDKAGKLGSLYLRAGDEEN